MLGIKSVKKYLEKNLKQQIDNLISSCYDAYCFDCKNRGYEINLSFDDFVGLVYKFNEERVNKGGTK